MRILCLHGRGSNNDIFKMQTAGFRSILEDYEFEFVQGQMPHVEGNWSIHTTDFAKSKLWGYYNLLDPYDVMKTERELLELMETEGPFDGILGYSMGGTLAAQTAIRYFSENPNASKSDWPFRFAIFFNASTPNRVFEVSKGDILPMTEASADPDLQRFYHAMRANPLLGKTPFFPGTLKYETKVLTDGNLAMSRCDPNRDGVLIKIPTLHVRDPGDEKDHGLELYQLCEDSLASQYFHAHGHDFPRGYSEMRKIAALIRKTAEFGTSVA